MDDLSTVPASTIAEIREAFAVSSRDDQDIWDMYFMAVCSIRFHPANQVENVGEIAMECAFAVDIVEEMMRCRSLRLRS